MALNCGVGAPVPKLPVQSPPVVVVPPSSPMRLIASALLSTSGVWACSSDSTQTRPCAAQASLQLCDASPMIQADRSGGDAGGVGDGGGGDGGGGDGGVGEGGGGDGGGGLGGCGDGGGGGGGGGLIFFINQIKKRSNNTIKKITIK